MNNFRDLTHKMFSCFLLVGCLDYLNEWLQHTLFLNEFEWITLAKVPEWDEIDKTARMMIDKGFFNLESHQQLFHVCTFLKAYMTDAKITEFNDTKTPIAERWTDFFKSSKDKINCEPLIQIVSYILAIPGYHSNCFYDFFLNTLFYV